MTNAWKMTGVYAQQRRVGRRYSAAARWRTALAAQCAPIHTPFSKARRSPQYGHPRARTPTHRTGEGRAYRGLCRGQPWMFTIASEFNKNSVRTAPGGLASIRIRVSTEGVGSPAFKLSRESTDQGWTRGWRVVCGDRSAGSLLTVLLLG